MFKGIDATARTLSYYLRRQEATAENLANVGGTAYKSIRATAHADPGGAPKSVEWTEWSQGALSRTDRPFDLALEGEGFLVVGTPNGERLTRGGSFQLDPGGRLLDASGFPLLGAGGPIHVAGTSFEVHADGEVVVDGARVDRLRVETPVDAALLERLPAGYFEAGERRAVDGAETKLRQRHLEGANVDPVLSMVDLIAIQRSYAANLQVMKTMDRVLGVAVTEVGDV
jgi:flagellar basal-body rod protein FlgF